MPPTCQHTHVHNTAGAQGTKASHVWIRLSRRARIALLEMVPGALLAVVPALSATAVGDMQRTQELWCSSPARPGLLMTQEPW